MDSLIKLYLNLGIIITSGIFLLFLLSIYSLFSLILLLALAEFVTDSPVYAMLLQRNYPFFILFISSSTLLCMYVFAFSWANLLRQKGKLASIMAHDAISVALIVYCFIVIWFVGGLTVFHLYLISTNQVFFLLLLIFYVFYL